VFESHAKGGPGAHLVNQSADALVPCVAMVMHVVIAHPAVKLSAGSATGLEMSDAVVREDAASVHDNDSRCNWSGVVGG